MQKFMLKRWVRVGGESGMEGLARAAGIEKPTLYRLTASESEKSAARLTTKEQVAFALGFSGWEELLVAYERDDVLHALPVVRLSEQAFRAAQAAAREAGVGVDEWVSRAVQERAAK